MNRAEPVDHEVERRAAAFRQVQANYRLLLAVFRSEAPKVAKKPARGKCGGTSHLSYKQRRR